MNIITVIVTYNPDIDSLRLILKSLSSQCTKLLLVDNDSDNFLIDHISEGQKLEIIKLNKNYGISYALNQGIIKAISHGATHCLLMDQDSQPADNMIQVLSEQYAQLSQKNDVAAVGPKIVLKKNPYHILGFKRFLGPFRYNLRNSDKSAVKCDYLITSGTFISVEKFKKIGEFEEELFIDYVDIEWGLRAKRQGLSCYGIMKTELYHQLGLSGKRFYYGHPPFRYYYICRNPLLLMRSKSLNVFEKVFFLVLTMSRPLVYLFMKLPDKKASYIYMYKGIIDGIKNRRGCYSG